MNTIYNKMLHFMTTTTDNNILIPTEGYQLKPHRPKQKPQQRQQRHKRQKKDTNNKMKMIIKPNYIITDMGGDEIVKPHIRYVIEDMVARRLLLNSACTIDAYPMRHSAAFVPGTKWREKSGIRGEFNSRGPFRVLLRAPR